MSFIQKLIAQKTAGSESGDSTFVDENDTAEMTELPGSLGDDNTSGLVPDAVADQTNEQFEYTASGVGPTAEDDTAETTPQDPKADILELRDPIPESVDSVAELDVGEENHDDGTEADFGLSEPQLEVADGAEIEAAEDTETEAAFSETDTKEFPTEPQDKAETSDTPDELDIFRRQPEAAQAAVSLPVPNAASSGGRRAGRVKTRLLGFDHANQPKDDPFDPNAAIKKSANAKFPVGWIVVVEGPGRGESFSLQAGMSQIGRGEDQAIQLDFGDASISRNNHAAIVYDIENHTFLLGHGGKANVVRLNDKPLLSTEKMGHADRIRIGETTLRLVVLCDENFNWEEDSAEGADDVAIA